MPIRLKRCRGLSALLERAKPKVTADLRIGKIVKKDKTTVNFIPEEVLSGQRDIGLEEGDRVLISSRFSREPVYVWGEVREGRTIPYYEGLRLMDALRDLEFRYDIRELKAVIYMKPEPMGYLKSQAEVSLEAKGSQDARAWASSQAAGAEMAGPKAVPQMKDQAMTQKVARSGTLPERETEPEVITTEVYLYDLFVLSQPEANVRLRPGARVVIQRTFRTEKGLTVTVLGQVFKPGKYELRKGMTLAEALKLSGGLAEGAYLKGLILIKQSAKSTQEANLELAFAALQEALFRQEEEMAIWEEEEKKMAESSMKRAREYLSLLKKDREEPGQGSARSS